MKTKTDLFILPHLHYSHPASLPSRKYHLKQLPLWHPEPPTAMPPRQHPTALPPGQILAVVIRAGKCEAAARVLVAAVADAQVPLAEAYAAPAAVDGVLGRQQGVFLG